VWIYFLNNSGAPSSTISVAVSLNPVNVLQTVSYTATVTPQAGGTVGGNVIFLDQTFGLATVAVTNNQATYATSYGEIGTHSISAVYSGDFGKATGSRSNTVTVNVRGISKTKVTTSGSPTFVGQPVTFTAKVSSKYGTIPDGELVTFYDGTAAMGSVALSNQAAAFTTSALSAKAHSIKAAYPGDASFAPSTGSVRQVVNAYPTSTTLTSNLNPSQYGQAVKFTVQVTSTGPSTPTGKVKFMDGTTSIGAVTLSGGAGTLTKSNLAVGTHAITAHYGGDSVSAKSTSPVLNQVVQ
jgi:Big-like domain-containing protein